MILFVSIMNAPNFLTYQIIERNLNLTCTPTYKSDSMASAFVPGISDLAMEADCLVRFIRFYEIFSIEQKFKRKLIT